MRFRVLDNEIEIDNYLDILKSNLLGNQKRIEELKKELAETKEEAFVGTEINKLKEENKRIREDMYRGFPISEEEQKEIRNWIKKHDEKQHKNPTGYHGAIGGGYHYNFMPTSIGVIATCICGSCRRRAIQYAADNNDVDKYYEYMEKHNGEFIFQGL